jgi:hypothetical protein
VLAGLRDSSEPCNASGSLGFDNAAGAVAHVAFILRRSRCGSGAFPGCYWAIDRSSINAKLLAVREKGRAEPRWVVVVVGDDARV